jgi:hypothetical protein
VKSDQSHGLLPGQPQNKASSAGIIFCTLLHRVYGTPFAAKGSVRAKGGKPIEGTFILDVGVGLPHLAATPFVNRNNQPERPAEDRSLPLLTGRQCYLGPDSPTDCEDERRHGISGRL